MDLMDTTDSTDDIDVQQHHAVAMALEMPEILEKIFGYLEEDEHKDLISAALVCRKWRDAAYHPSLWRKSTACLILQPLDTVQVLPSLARRRLPGIEINGLRTHMRDLLPSLPSLKSFCFVTSISTGYSSYPMTDRTLHGALQQRHTELTSFILYNCNRITDASVILLSSRLPNLKKLALNKCMQVSDAGLVAVARDLLRLQELSLEYCPITDAGVAALAGGRPEVAPGIPKLSRLSLAKCRITDTTLLHVSVGLPSITYLKLSGCRKLTDAGLLHLVNMRALRRLEVHRCKRITDDGPLQIPFLKKDTWDGEYLRSRSYGLADPDCGPLKIKLALFF